VAVTGKKMPKDFKIGMILGLVLIIIGTFWLRQQMAENS
jgi:hypothetical protein